MNDFIIIALIGLAAGLLAGIMGIGGGLIVIPALVILGFSQKLAQGTSLAMMLPPIGFFAAYNYYKAGFVDVKATIILICFFIIGSLFTSKLAVAMDPRILKKIFGGFLILVALKMIFGK